jgi:hypothetical protein
VTGRCGFGTLVDVGDEDAEFLVDPGASTLGTGYIGVRTNQNLEISPTGGALVLKNRHCIVYLPLQEQMVSHEETTTGRQALSIRAFPGSGSVFPNVSGSRDLSAGPREGPILDESPTALDHTPHLLISFCLGAAIDENDLLLGVLSAVFEKHVAPPLKHYHIC